MKRMFLLPATALMAVGLAAAGGRAKTYDIVLGEPTVTGSVTLKPGEYRVKISGVDAVFIDQQNHQVCSVPFKLETTSAKHENTAIRTSNQNGQAQLESMDLGGTDETLEFAAQ